MKANIVVAISSSIAVFKAAQLVSDLVKEHSVQVVMTANATKYMSALTFETLTKRPVYTQMYGDDVDFSSVAHIEVAKWADLIVACPATANLIAKMAHGIADDFVSTLMLAARCPILVCPAMNTTMLNHPATQDNLATLIDRGVAVVGTGSGLLACGDVGDGKLASLDLIEDQIVKALADQDADLAGLNLTITAGPTREAIDPVRFITNHSTGKMGYALAEVAARRGAKVVLISGPVGLTPPSGVDVIDVVSAQDMFEAVRQTINNTDILIKSAAVADYRPAEIAEHKIKKSGEAMSIQLERTTDILHWVGTHATPGLVVCGFAMETENLLANAQSKLEHKNCDLLVANSLRTPGAGFGTDTNVATLIWPDRTESLPIMSKMQLADRILSECAAIHRRKQQA